MARKETEKEKFERINSGNFTLFDPLETGDANSGPISLNLKLYEDQKKKQEEENNRSLSEWKDLRDKSTLKYLEQEQATNALLRNSGLKAKVASTQIIPDVAPSIKDVKIGDTFKNNLLSDVNNRVATYDFLKSDVGKGELIKLSNAWEEKARNISGYEVKKALEDERNESTITKLALSPIRGATSMLSWTRGDLETSEGRLQSYNNAFLSAQRENASNPLLKWAYGAGAEIGKQRAVNFLNKIIPGLGATLYFGDIYDDQVQSALSRGYSDKASRNYAVLSTASEAIFEHYLGAGSEYFGGSKNGLEGLLSSTVFKGVKNKTVNDILSSFLSEGTEEFLEEYLGNFNEQLTLDWADKGKNIDMSFVTDKKTLEDAFESFIIGGITGAYGAGADSVTTPKSTKNLNQALYTLEREYGEISEPNKNFLTTMAYLGEASDHVMTTKELLDTYQEYRDAQVSDFENSALSAYPNLDENSRVMYNDLINDIGKLIRETGVSIVVEPELQTVSEWVGGTLYINPSLTSMPIKTLILKELSTELIDNSVKSYIIKQMKKNGTYNDLRQDILDKGEATEKNVDNEVVAYELNRIFNDQNAVNQLFKENEGLLEKIKSTIDPLVATITNRPTKDAQYLRELGNKLNIAGQDINNLKVQDLKQVKKKAEKPKQMADTYKENINNYKGYGKKTIQNAINSKLISNTPLAHKIVNLSAKVSEHINKEFVFTNEENLKDMYKKLRKSKDIKKGEIINGYTDGDKIVVNIDSPEALNFIIGHEVSHVMKNSKYWGDLKDALISLAEFRGDYQKFANRIKEAYPNLSDTDLNEELVSDLVGKYLFTDQEFIDRISSNKSLVSKIINVIKDLINKIKEVFGKNSEEQKLLNKALKSYENAYNDTYKQNNEFKLSLNEQNGDNQEITDNKGRKLTKGQQKYFGKSKVVDENGNLITVYHTTTEPLVQFNEFNPVGTSGYRFRDQVVNYYSDDKIMSGSYASRHTDYGSIQNYNMADPSKLKSIDEAKKWIEENRFAGLIPYDYELSEKDENGYIKLKLYDFDSGNKILEQNYNSDKTLLKNIRQDIQKVTKPIMHNIQYEGYLSIKNPYVVDAKGNYWNRVKNDIEGYISDFINKINQTPELKDRAIKLAKESEKEYNKYLKSDSKRAYYLLQEMKYDIQGNVEEIVGYASSHNLDYDVVLKKRGKRLLDLYPPKVAEHTPSGNSLLYDFIPDNYHGYFTEKLKKIGIDFNKLTIKQYTNMLRESMKDDIKYGCYDSYFSNKIEDVLGKETYNNLVSNGVGKFTLYDIASHNFDENYLSDNYGRSMTTNDVVIQIIKDNVLNNAGYDGVIFKNVIDYGGSAHENESAHDVYVTFNSNQFKSVENKTPTSDPDWRYSLSETPTEEYGNFNVYGKDIKAKEILTKPVEKKNIPKVETKAEPKQPATQNVGQEKYLSTDKLPETTKPGTYIQPSTPIKTDTRKGKKYVKQITNQNILRKEISKNYTSFVDKLNPIQELADVSGNQELYAKFNNRGMSNGKGQYQIGTAQTDINGVQIGKSVNEIFKPAEKTGLTTEFDDYLAHKLNIERYDKVPVWDETVTPEISQEIVDEYDAKYSKFKEWADDVYKFNDNQLQKMIDGGLSKENARDWLYDNYVTIARDIGPTTNPLLVNAKGVSINSPIRKAKGSNLAMRPMKEAMARQTLLTERAIADNIAGQELLNVLGGTVGSTKNVVTQDLEGNNNALIQNPDGTYNYTVYKNGVPVTMQVTKEVADAIRPSKTKEWEDLLPFKVVRGLSGLQRGLLTDKNPLFIFTNFFKDIGDAPLNSKFGAGEMYANYPKAVAKMLSNSKEWQQYVANGGLSNTYFETKSGEFVKSKNKFVRAIQTMNELVEQAPRFTEYLNTLAHGGTIQEALYNSAEVTTNFARGGEITKILNRNGFNFLNASVQGFDKQIRNFTRQPGAKGYVQLLTKVALLGVAPALLNNYLLGDDDDYEELPDYVKDNYYLFKTEDNKFIRIPKGRVMSVFGTTARHLVEIGKGNETFKDLVNDTGEQIMNNVAPNNPIENNIIAPLLSVANNKSWSGGKIVSTTLQNYPDAYQYDEKTTSIAKWLGKTFNISPKKIDYLLDQYTGGIGDVVMPMTTPYAETETDNVLLNATLAPFVSKFTVDSTITNKYVNDYYDTKNELQKELKTYSSIEDSPESFEKALQYKYLDSVGKEISELYVAKREIQNSDLPNDEKYEQAREIQRQIDDLAKFAMQDYTTGYYTDDYAVVGDKEFTTKITNGKLNWSEIDAKTKKKQLEYAEKYDMSPEEFYSMEGLTGSAITGTNIYDFKELNSKLAEIRDNTTEDKTETFKYVNSLDLSIPQKAMFLRKYYKSYNAYNKDIFNYVNSLDMIDEQKKAILIYLGFDYNKNTGVFSWK